MPPLIYFNGFDGNLAASLPGTSRYIYASGGLFFSSLTAKLKTRLPCNSPLILRAFLLQAFTWQPVETRARSPWQQPVLQIRKCPEKPVSTSQSVGTGDRGRPLLTPEMLLVQ